MFSFDVSVGNFRDEDIFFVDYLSKEWKHIIDENVLKDITEHFKEVKK